MVGEYGEQRHEQGSEAGEPGRLTPIGAPVASIEPPSSQPMSGQQRRPTEGRWSYVHRFEQVMTTLLMAMMAIVVVLSVADLAWLLLKDILSPPLVLLDVHELLGVFDAFLLVLMGIELLETLKVYVREREIRAEVIIMVGIIALARKIITLDMKAIPSASLLGIAAIVLALGISHYLIRLTRNRGAGSPLAGKA